MLTTCLLDKSGRLATDATCVECGHNLRGLAADGVCCECGYSVALSLRGARLASADPQWLGQVSGGVGTLTLLLPWLWLPLLWPLVVIAAWLAASPNPAAGAPARRVAWLRRHGLLAALVIVPLATWYVGPLGDWEWPEYLGLLGLMVGVFVVWLAILVPGLAVQAGLARLGRFLYWHAAAWYGAIVGLVWASFRNPLVGASSEWIVLLIALLLLIGVSGLVVIPIAMLRIWRALDSALTLASAYSRAAYLRASAPTAPPPPMSPPAPTAAPPAPH